MEGTLSQQKKHVVRGKKIWHIGRKHLKQPTGLRLKNMEKTSAAASLPATHPVQEKSVGIILCNLGTPEAPTPQAVRVYLKEFLSDPRVIEVPKLIWWFVLRCIILPFRAKKSARAYAKIWDKTYNESPLRAITYQQQEALEAGKNLPPHFKVAVGMRYGTPSIKGVVQKLMAQGCNRLLFFPLYPHYAGATVGSAYDAFFKELMAQRWAPTTHIVAPYFDHRAYIKALVMQTQDFLNKLHFKPEKIILSYHGIPQKTHENGDPYPCHCRKTSRLFTQALPLAELGLRAEDIVTTFQSRFGPAEWVKPYTDETLEELPKKGIKKIVVLTPAFHTDCLETLEEIALEGKETFLNAGGTHYATAPCLNASAPSIKLLEELILENTTAWQKAVK